MSDSEIETVFYFGCESPRSPGHYLFSPGMRPLMREERRALPTSLRCPDGCFAPGGIRAGTQHQVEGRALLHFEPGWTVLSFWDRSGDSRYGSSSTFMTRGRLQFAAMMLRIREQWPQLCARWKFEVVLAGPDLKLEDAPGESS